MVVVAEGVEDQPTWDLLRDLGCDLAQGFLATRPLAPDDLDRWLAAREHAEIAAASAPAERRELVTADTRAA